MDTVEQVYYRVDGRDKTRALRSLLDAESAPLAIVFRRTKHGATKLHRELERGGYRAGLLHGGKRGQTGQRGDVFSERAQPEAAMKVLPRLL